MIPVRLGREEVGAREPDDLVEELQGAILALDVGREDPGEILRKGTRLEPEDVRRLLELSWDELHLLKPEEGDVHESEAGERLARAVAGEGVELGKFGGGHWPLRSRTRGILRVDAEALETINRCGEISVYTHLDGRVVGVGDTVARAKVIPFLVSEGILGEAVERAREKGGVVGIRPFHPTRITAVVQESLGEGAVARFREALEEKVSWFGSTLDEPLFVPPEVEALSGALDEVLGREPGLVVMAGTKAMDPLDPAFRALDRLGARMVRHGVPAHPGSLLWLARRDGVPVLGMPTCGLFSRATVFDLVLARILADLPVGDGELSSLGHGGFLTRDMSWRFPPYREAGPRGEVE